MGSHIRHKPECAVSLRIKPLCKGCVHTKDNHLLDGKCVRVLATLRISLCHGVGATSSEIEVGIEVW